jgi:hypothetical protein
VRRKIISGQVNLARQLSTHWQLIHLTCSGPPEANKKLSDQLTQNKKLTQEVRNANQTAVRANAEKINAECRVPDIAIELHNSASKNQISGSSSGTTGILPAPKPSRP